MKALDIARIIFFYILIGSIVLFSPLGPVPSYLFIIVLSLTFMLISGIKVRAGNPIMGLIVATLAMIAIFLIIASAGGLQVQGLQPDFANALILGAALQLFVATGEELSFRHYLFSDLDRLTGRKVAAVTSSAGFAAMHLPSLFLLNATPAEYTIALITIFIASLTMTVLFLKAGILAAIGFHFAWNFLQYHVFGFGHLAAAMEIAVTGNNFLTGGTFGPEASIPGLVVVAVTLGAVWYYYSRRESKMPESQR